MSDESPSRLGRGLSALLPGAAGQSTPNTVSVGTPAPSEVRQFAISDIEPSSLQPRRIFDDQEMESLIRSVAEKGVLQPILIRPIDGGRSRYELVAGERRWRAAQAAQLHEIPAVVRDLDDQEALEIALVENLQRDALTPLEEAQGYQRLIDQFNHTQEDVAVAVGKSRSHVANTVRLLGLPSSIKAALDDGDLTAGHARALMAAAEPEGLAKTVIKKGLNVRQTERLVKAESHSDLGQTKGGAQPAGSKSADILALERRLSDSLGVPVDISFDGKGGKLMIDYRTLDKLDDIIQRLTAEEN